MNADDIRNFRARDWQLIERLKSECWVEQKTGMSTTAVFGLAAQLFEYARALRPDWPNAAERESDLASHIRLVRMLRRVAIDSAR